MEKVLVPFNNEEKYDGDCMLTGEQSIPYGSTPEEVRLAVAHAWLDEDSTYEEFVEEFSTTVDGVWVIEEDTHKAILNSIPDCGNDSAVYAAIRTIKNTIAGMSTETILFD